jgi:ferritin-like metal-binding protein YciE
MARDLRTQLTKYLTDAHAIEAQALAQLRAAPDLAGEAELARAYREHLAETEEHERLTRQLLEERGAAPSRVEDAAMAIGGKAFALFARLQPDTPGKLHAHALSYEALELASYELLGRVAEQAGEPDVARAAGEIAAEERRMMERLEHGFERAVDASLAALAPDDLGAQVRSYLADAHALTGQEIALFERAPQHAGDGDLAGAYAAHLALAREHAVELSTRLRALGGDASGVKDAALRLGALNWVGFFRAHPDTPGKLAAFTFAFCHLLVGGDEQLALVADRAGDPETAALARRHAADERAAAGRIAASFDDAAVASLEAVGAR